MVVNVTQLLHLPVRTRSGTPVGKVSGIVMETDTGRIDTLLVNARRGLLGRELRVAWSQVVSLTDQEAVIDDAVVAVPTTHMALEGADV